MTGTRAALEHRHVVLDGQQLRGVCRPPEPGLAGLMVEPRVDSNGGRKEAQGRLEGTVSCQTL